MQNLVYECVKFSKCSQIWANSGSNLRKNGNFGENLAQNQVDRYMSGSLFFSKIGICIDPLPPPPPVNLTLFVCHGWMYNGAWHICESLWIRKMGTSVMNHDERSLGRVCFLSHVYVIIFWHHSTIAKLEVRCRRGWGGSDILVYTCMNIEVSKIPSNEC